MGPPSLSGTLIVLISLPFTPVALYRGIWFFRP